MKLIYDSRHNIASIRFQEKTAEVETIQLSDALNVDLASDGAVYGIELLNANAQLRGDDGGRLLVVCCVGASFPAAFASQSFFSP